MSMTTFAALFPGQGSQYVGMGARYQQAPIGRRVYDRADATLGLSLSRLSVEGPQAELRLTANAQPAFVAYATPFFLL
jgi:[acyl-carrier-protein] S-malonyltransferase